MQPAPQWSRATSGGNRFGPSGAPLTIVVFYDYECRWCRLLEGVLQVARMRYGEQMTTVYRHFPRADLASLSFAAAVAVQCAADQGEFEKMHSALARRFGRLAQAEWMTIADDIGMPNRERFHACLADTRTTSAVLADRELGAALGVAVTPTILTSGLLIRGVVSLDELEALRALSSRPGR